VETLLLSRFLLSPILLLGAAWAVEPCVQSVSCVQSLSCFLSFTCEPLSSAGALRRRRTRIPGPASTRGAVARERGRLLVGLVYMIDCCLHKHQDGHELEEDVLPCLPQEDEVRPAADEVRHADMHQSSIDMYNNDVGQESAQKFMK
jgi:hypothetical protein